jgi:choline dehydrogenase-like flavoprotein
MMMMMMMCVILSNIILLSFPAADSQIRRDEETWVGSFLDGMDGERSNGCRK